MDFNVYTPREAEKTRLCGFGGLNRRKEAARNEFSDMYNMTTDEYPCLAPCGKRMKIAEAEHINTVAAPDVTNVSEVKGITGVCDGGFCYNGELKSEKFELPADMIWQIKQMGNMYIINGFDKGACRSVMYYYNIDTDEFDEGGKILHNLIVTTGKDSSGNPYIQLMGSGKNGVYAHSITTDDGKVINNSDYCDEYLTEYYNSGSSGGYTLSKTENLFQKQFKIGDEITLEGFPGADNNGQAWSVYSDHVLTQSAKDTSKNNTVDTDNMPTTKNLSEYSICTATVTGFSITSTASYQYAHRMYLKLTNKDGEDATFVNLTDSGIYVSGITVSKRTKVLDGITIHHGRIWGSAPSGNQLYASASDDVFSFSSQDISKKYAARIPSDSPGTFTALCSYNNDLIAFKPDNITVISGTNPTNYSSYTIDGIGCIAPKSVAVTPEGVIFLGRKGFYIYNGASPKCISEKLHTVYKDAVGGFDGETYFVSAVKKDDTAELLAYSMNRGLWYKRDDFSAVGFFGFCDGFFGADDTAVYRLDTHDAVEWSFTLARTHENNLDNKGINEIRVRAEMEEGAIFCVETAVGDGEFVSHTAFSKPGLNVYRCPIRLKLGENYRIRIKGSGNMVIYEIEVQKTVGGGRYKEY